MGSELSQSPQPRGAGVGAGHGAGGGRLAGSFVSQTPPAPAKGVAGGATFLSPRRTANQRAVSDDASCDTLYAGCGAGQALQVAAAEVGTVRCTPATQPWMCRSWSARTPRQPAEPGPPRVPSAAAAWSIVKSWSRPISTGVDMFIYLQREKLFCATM